VGPDAAPDQMGARTLALAVFEGRSAIRCPGHLEDARRSLDALDSQAWPKATCTEVDVELAEGQPVSVLVIRTQSSPVAIELSSSRIRRHALVERVEKFVSALCRGDPSIANVLARLPLPALPGIGPEPSLLGVNELLGA